MRTKPRTKRKPVTGMNPVARAVANETLQSAARTLKAKVVCMQEGEHDRKLVLDVGHFFTTVIIAVLHDKLQDDKTYNYVELVRLVDRGLNCMVEMSRNKYRWNYSRALDVTDAVDACVLMVPKLTPEAVQHGCKATEHIDD